MTNARELVEGTTREWQPHERNYSGGRFGVWHDDQWTMLRVEAGVGDVTASIRDHEAWDLALRLSPKLQGRIDYLFNEMKQAQAGLYEFTYASNLAPLLRKIADEWDCDSAQCEYAGSDLGALVCPCMDDERGCRAVEAAELRQFAAALETAERVKSDLARQVTQLEAQLAERDARIQADAATIAGMTKWDRGGLLFDALCRVRCRNAADFSDRFTASQREAYDKGVLACFAEIGAALKGGDHG